MRLESNVAIWNGVIDMVTEPPGLGAVPMKTGSTSTIPGAGGDPSGAGTTATPAPSVADGPRSIAAPSGCARTLTPGRNPCTDVKIALIAASATSAAAPVAGHCF